jgi:hypothetical protein
LSEHYVTPGPDKVDMLFVIDNALSTVTYQKSLGKRFSILTSALSGIDWQIGITTTDVSEGPFGLKGSLAALESGDGNQTIITSTDPQAATLFESTVVRPETISCGFSPSNPCASPWVQPLKASIDAMDKRNSDNAGFFRDSADLAIVYLSNKDEMRDGKSFNPTTPAELISHFNSIWPSGKKLEAFGIVIIPEDVKCLAEQKKDWPLDPAYATFVTALGMLTQGGVESLCDKDYNKTIFDIGQKVSETARSIDLKFIPKPGTLTITMNPKQNILWRLEGKRVYFASTPKLGTEITVHYIPQ